MGIHINMASIYVADAKPKTPEEKELFKQRSIILDWETGYNHEQETQPQTLGVARADRPVGIAGWILEKFGKWADLPKDKDGNPEIWSKFTEQQMLDNIMLYIGTSSQVTATWIYHGKSLRIPASFLPVHILIYPRVFRRFRILCFYRRLLLV